MMVFAQIESASILREAGDVLVVLRIAFRGRNSIQQHAQCTMPWRQMPEAMEMLGLSDFEKINGHTVRIELDSEGVPIRLAGPEDGSWLTH